MKGLITLDFPSWTGPRQYASLSTHLHGRKITCLADQKATYLEML